MDFFQGVNEGARYFFKFQADTWPQLKPVMEFGSFLGSYPIVLLLGICTLAVLVLRKQYRLALCVVLVLALGAGIAESIRHSPPLDPTGEKLHPSYPSQPVLLGFLVLLLWAMAMNYALPGRSWGIGLHGLAIVLGLWICMGQLFLGRALVSDVIAGLTGGVGLALLGRGLGPSAKP